MNINEILMDMANFLDTNTDPAWVAEGDQLLAESDAMRNGNPEFYRGFIHGLMEVASNTDDLDLSMGVTILAAQVYKRCINGLDVYTGEPL